MESIYEFEAYKEKFIVNFHSFMIDKPIRWITVCTLHEVKGKSVYAGATIKNPHDNSNTWIARRWAFKRSVMMIYLVWVCQKKTSVNYEHFWQTFRLGLAKNETYLKDRKEEKDG